MVVVVVLLGDLAVDDTIEHSLLLEKVLSATMCVIQWREKKGKLLADYEDSESSEEWLADPGDHALCPFADRQSCLACVCVCVCCCLSLLPIFTCSLASSSFKVDRRKGKRGTNVRLGVGCQQFCLCLVQVAQLCVAD